MTIWPPSTEDGLEVTMARQATSGFRFEAVSELQPVAKSWRTGRHNPGRYADGNRPGRHVFPDDGAGADDGVGANVHAIEDLGARTSPGALTDCDAGRRPRLRQHSLRRVGELMASADDVCVRGEQRAGAYADLAG